MASKEVSSMSFTHKAISGKLLAHKALHIRFSINFLAHKAFILVFNEKLGEIHAIKLILQVEQATI